MIKNFFYMSLSVSYLYGMLPHNAASYVPTNVLVLNYNSNYNAHYNENINNNNQASKKNTGGENNFLDSFIFNKKIILLSTIIGYLYTKNTFDCGILFLCGKRIFFFVKYLLKKYILFLNFRQQKGIKDNASL